MEYIIWIGAVISFAGLIGIFYCIALALKAKRAKLADAEMGVRMQRIVVLNMAAFFISVFGLMMVIVGIFLG